MAHDDSNYLVLRLALCFGKIRPLADQKNPELCHLDTPTVDLQRRLGDH